ncbi:MAG: hypothetical protein DMG08_27900 [Acidobacteria bacterium]|nr:MAG: hypothetical protein DMG08_27900 [Acidobacteriota bacterium]
MSEDKHRSADADLWTRILARIAEIVSPGCFDTWFRPLAFAGREGSTLLLNVPNETFRKWLLDTYSEPLRQAVTQIAGPHFEVRILTDNAAERSHSRNACEQTGNGTSVPLPVVRASALHAPAQPQTWLVEQLWTNGAVGVIGGSPKSGKSWLALGPVLLYAAEDSAAALRARLETLSRIRQLDFASLDVRVITAESLRLDRIEDQDRLKATVFVHHPVLLVLDPLVRVHAIDENVAGQVAALLGYLRTLQRKTGVAVALIHHLRKNPSPSGGAGYSLRGSSDLYAWLDSFLCLRKHHDQLTLSAEHRSAQGAGPFPLELAQPSGDTGAHLRLVSTDRAEAGPKEDALPGRILQRLSGATEPITVEALRNGLQVRNQRVVAALRQLLSQGAIQRLPRGYVLAAQSSLPLMKHS